MKKSRKTKLYFILAISCLLILCIICFIFPLPDDIPFNCLRGLIILLGVCFFVLYEMQKNDCKQVSNDSDVISRLRENYSDINTIVQNSSKLIYDNMPSDFIEKYNISIDEYDHYLLDFQNNLKTFLESSEKEEISNDYVYVAAVMDSLISSWKIKSSIPKQIAYIWKIESFIPKQVVCIFKIKTSIPDQAAYISELSEANCKLAVSVALSMLNLSDEALNDNPYFESFVSVLQLICLYKEYGKITTIVQETLILQLLITNIFFQN